MKKKHNHIKATIEVLGHRYHVEEFSENNENRYLFRREDGKGKAYAPRIDTIGNCLTAFTNIYKKTVFIKDTVIGCDKTNVSSAIELGYLDKEGKWTGNEPPKESDAFIIVFHTHLKRKAAKEIKKEMERNRVKKEIPIKVEKENVDLTRLRRLFDAYLNTADNNKIKVLEDLLANQMFIELAGQMFIQYKEKLIGGY